MRSAAFGVAWLPVEILESFLKTKWKIYDYTNRKMRYDDVKKKNPEVLISFSPPEELINHSSIKYIVSSGAGVDAVNTELIKANNQILISTHGNAETVSEHAWAMLMHIQRKLGKYDRLVRERMDWPSSNQIYDYSTDLSGKTIGILGYGNIAKNIERYATAFGMEIRIFRNNALEGQFFDYELIDNADELDVLMIAAPLTSKTRGLVSERIIHRMPSHSVLVNVGRGAIIDENALFNALRDGELRAAAIDTWQNSPYSKGELGNKPEKFVDIPNLLISPHRAWVSKKSIVETLRGIAVELDKIARNEKSDNIHNFEDEY